MNKVLSEATKKMIDEWEYDIWTYYDDEGSVYNDEDVPCRDYHTGVSKVVIVLEDCVLKKSFCGTLDYYSDRAQEADVDEDNPIEEYFDHDDCEIECEVYQLAKEYGVEKFFAEVKYSGKNKVYIQEKCEYTIDDYEDILESEEEDDIAMLPPVDGHELARGYDYIEDLCKRTGLKELGDRCRYSSAVAYLIANYSMEDVRKLEEFLVKFDINDIHARNIGVTKDSQIKIFDYCGYGSSTVSQVLNAY